MIYSITVRNVNEALWTILRMLHTTKLVRRDTRESSTWEYSAPVVTTYLNPTERVLFSPVRDANPFFHLFESLWILAGRYDVAPMKALLPRIADYSDDGRVFHGAYGRRLYAHEQLTKCIRALKDDPYTRRAVLAIWQPDKDAGYTGKDMPCNCTVTFKLVDRRLNMTVFNRSNDIVWGAYGANAVQFSMLHEYVAACVNLPVGVYYQISDSLHVYTDNPPAGALLEYGSGVCDRYRQGDAAPLPLLFDGSSTAEWLHDARWFFINMHADCSETGWWRTVAAPLWKAHMAYRDQRMGAAIALAETCAASDWRIAAVEWLERRVARRALKDTQA